MSVQPATSSLLCTKTTASPLSLTQSVADGVRRRPTVVWVCRRSSSAGFSCGINAIFAIPFVGEAIFAILLKNVLNEPKTHVKSTSMLPQSSQHSTWLNQTNLKVDISNMDFFQPKICYFHHTGIAMLSGMLLMDLISNLHCLDEILEA